MAYRQGAFMQLSSTIQPPAPPRAFAILESALRSGYLIIRIVAELAKAKGKTLFQLFE
jgi:hypothetical protein